MGFDVATYGSMESSELDDGMPSREVLNRERQAGYDLDGYIKKYGVPDQSNGQHLADEFKLPSHITFSTDSIYSTPETPGGEWKRMKDGRWSYTPSDYVLKEHSAEELKSYFDKYEPDSVLILPSE